MCPASLPPAHSTRAYVHGPHSWCTELNGKLAASAAVGGALKHPSTAAACNETDSCMRLTADRATSTPAPPSPRAASAPALLPGCPSCYSGAARQACPCCAAPTASAPPAHPHQPGRNQHAAHQLAAGFCRQAASGWALCSQHHTSRQAASGWALRSQHHTSRQAASGLALRGQHHTSRQAASGWALRSQHHTSRGADSCSMCALLHSLALSNNRCR